MAPLEGDDESPKAACRKACFSVTAVTSSILSKVPNARLLPMPFWRKEGPIDPSFSSFCEVMLGQMPSQSQQMCLHELSFDGLQQLVSDDEQPVTGLTVRLSPYLEDLLVRRQGFRGFVEVLASVADANENLPQILSEVTAKDLFIALLLVTPSRLKRIRLATDYVQSLKAPLPLVFRHPEWSGGTSNGNVLKAKAQAEFELLQDLACVPEEGRTLILSLGTEQVVGSGKTTLLGAMGLAKNEDLDVRPSGPMHHLSCDLFCDALWLLDVHGSMDDDMRNAVLALNLWGSAVALVHCAVTDFHSTGLPRKELTGLLNDLTSHLTLGTRQLRGSGIIILVRDSSEESLANRRPAMESGLSQWCTTGGTTGGTTGSSTGSSSCSIPIFAVEDCRNFRSATRRATAMDKLRARLEETWTTTAATAAVGTGCLEDLRRVHGLLGSGASSGSALRDRDGHGPKATTLGTSSLGRRLIQILDRALKAPSLYEALFPLSAIKRQDSVQMSMIILFDM